MHRHKLGEGAFAKVFERRYRGQPCVVKVFREDVLINKQVEDPQEAIKCVGRNFCVHYGPESTCQNHKS